MRKVQLRGGARRLHASRTRYTVSAQPRAPTKQMGLYHSTACLAEHVLPDTVGPPNRVLRPRFRLARRELLLDLDHFAALDLVAVDHRDRLFVAHPAVAGVPRR